MKNKFAIFGNPIKHSLSPKIYNIFAKKYNISSSYISFLVDEKNFFNKINYFFNNGGLGANITMPFKELAYSICNNLTTIAEISGSVNTIKKQSDGSILGDNTDGIGLINDLQRINYIDEKRNHVLLIGAGGAARGIIYPLLKIGCDITIINRTFERAKILEHKFSNLKLEKRIKAIKIKDLLSMKDYSEYNIIINATSTSAFGNIPTLPDNLISSKIKCYDLFYNTKEETSFISWCRNNGSEFCSDGLGMLIGQAAYSFLLWHGIKPDIIPVLKKLRNNFL